MQKTIDQKGILSVGKAKPRRENENTRWRSTGIGRQNWSRNAGESSERSPSPIRVRRAHLRPFLFRQSLPPMVCFRWFYRGDTTYIVHLPSIKPSCYKPVPHSRSNGTLGSRTIRKEKKRKSGERTTAVAKFRRLASCNRRNVAGKPRSPTLLHQETGLSRQAAGPFQRSRIRVD